MVCGGECEVIFGYDVCFGELVMVGVVGVLVRVGGVISG